MGYDSAGTPHCSYGTVPVSVSGDLPVRLAWGGIGLTNGYLDTFSSDTARGYEVPLDLHLEDSHLRGDQ